MSIIGKHTLGLHRILVETSEGHFYEADPVIHQLPLATTAARQLASLFGRDSITVGAIAPEFAFALRRDIEADGFDPKACTVYVTRPALPGEENDMIANGHFPILKLNPIGEGKVRVTLGMEAQQAA